MRPRPITSVSFQALSLLCAGLSVVLPGCGSSSQPASAINLQTWTGDAVSATSDSSTTTTTTPKVDTATSTGTSTVTGNNARSVSGTSLGNAPVLYVSQTALNLPAVTSHGSFLICNQGGGTLNYQVTADQAWLSLTNASGTISGTCRAVGVDVLRSGLPVGDYAGVLSVESDAGSATVEVHMTVSTVDQAQAILSVSTDALDFGSSTRVGTFTVQNRGGGQLSYSITSDASWATVTPASGAVTTSAATITVNVVRNPLVTGSHTASITVQTTNGQSATVWVLLTKLVTNPLIIPWVEAHYADAPQIDVVVQGLEIWRRVTDTAIVSTGPGRGAMYATLHQRVPNMRIIPGLTTSGRLGHDSFDTLAGWQLLGGDIADIAQAAGENAVVLEHESSINSWLMGTSPINMDQLRTCLSYVPDNIQIWWYPGIVVSSGCPDCVARTTALCQLVQEEIDVRFVDFSYCFPEWPDAPANIEARRIMDAMGEHPLLPIIYFQGCSQTMRYWEWDAAPTILSQLQGRPDAIFYPGLARWSSVAQAVADSLGEPPVQP